jgi:hypothetical protein
MVVCTTLQQQKMLIASLLRRVLLSQRTGRKIGSIIKTLPPDGYSTQGSFGPKQKKKGCKPKAYSLSTA